MPDPGKEHVTLNLPDLHNKYITDPAHIPGILKSLGGDEVEPVELSKALLERRIGSSSGIENGQPSLSFAGFDEMDSELPFVLKNGECHVVPTHEDGSNNFLESLSLLLKLLKLSGEHESVFIWVPLCFPVPKVQTLDF